MRSHPLARYAYQEFQESCVTLATIVTTSRYIYIYFQFL